MSYIRTEAHKKRMSEIKKKHWRENIEFREKQIKHLRGIWKNPEHRKFMTKRFTREKNPRWKNGIRHTGNGYIHIYTPKHPNAYENYVPQQNLVVEQQIGRYLKSKEVVHHINKINNDNRLQNLIFFKNISSHKRFHNNPNNVKVNEIIFDGRKLIQRHSK